MLRSSKKANENNLQASGSFSPQHALSNIYSPVYAGGTTSPSNTRTNIREYTNRIQSQNQILQKISSHQKSAMTNLIQQMPGGPAAMVRDQKLSGRTAADLHYQRQFLNSKVDPAFYKGAKDLLGDVTAGTASANARGGLPQ